MDNQKLISWKDAVFLLDIFCNLCYITSFFIRMLESSSGDRIYILHLWVLFAWEILSKILSHWGTFSTLADFDFNQITFISLGFLFPFWCSF